MASVKNERARLLEQLTMIKTDPGKAGADLQQDDILNLRREVEIKKAKLDELHEVHPFEPGTTDKEEYTMLLADDVEGSVQNRSDETAEKGATPCSMA